MEKLKEKIKIMILGNEYTVSFPNVKQFIDIESTKTLLSNGMYRSMEMQRSENSARALNMIDIEAYFSILIPEFSQDLKVPFSELSLQDFAEIEKVYVGTFLPWYNAWIKAIKDVK